MTEPRPTRAEILLGPQAPPPTYLHDAEAIEQALDDALAATVPCTFCQRPVSAHTAHRHQNAWIGDCCWDERLRTTE